jgi:hypothetical protein
METDAQGFVEFLNLRPGDYTLRETQPSDYLDGVDSLGTVNGIPTGDATVNDQFSKLILPSPGSDAVNYNFGERPPSEGEVSPGQTAAIAFWQNKKGQELIRSLNGGPDATQLGDWLAATFPNMYGAGANDLTGKTNDQVAAIYVSLFKQNGQTSPGGPPKLDAQVLATSLAVYVTNQTLAGMTAANYGFQVTEYGLGVKTFNVGDSGAAFGVASGATMSTLDILLATNARARHGLLYDQDGSGTIDSLERFLRELAHEVFSGINEQGSL